MGDWGGGGERTSGPRLQCYRDSDGPVSKQISRRYQMRHRLEETDSY